MLSGRHLIWRQNPLSLYIFFDGEEVKSIFLLCSLPSSWHTFCIAISNSTLNSNILYNDCTNLSLLKWVICFIQTCKCFTIWSIFSNEWGAWLRYLEFPRYTFGGMYTTPCGWICECFSLPICKRESKLTSKKRRTPIMSKNREKILTSSFLHMLFRGLGLRWNNNIAIKHSLN